MEIAGPDSSQHDRLVVSGNAELKGTLHVSLVAPYVPALGDSFVIMTYDGLQGDFPQLDLPPLPDGMGWQLRYRPTLLSLRASTTTDVEGEPSPGTGGNLPLAFHAYPNEPNPFNPTTRIRFDLPREAVTDLVIYDARGRVVRRLLEGCIQPGDPR